MSTNWKNVIKGMLSVNGKNFGEVEMTVAMQPADPIKPLTIHDLDAMMAKLPPPRLNDNLCQMCGREFRPGMPRDVGLCGRDSDALPSGWLCAVCGDAVRDRYGDISAKAEIDGQTWFYRGPRDGIEQWARDVERQGRQ